MVKIMFRSKLCHPDYSGCSAWDCVCLKVPLPSSNRHKDGATQDSCCKQACTEDTEHRRQQMQARLFNVTLYGQLLHPDNIEFVTIQRASLNLLVVLPVINMSSTYHSNARCPTLIDGHLAFILQHVFWGPQIWRVGQWRGNEAVFKHFAITAHKGIRTSSVL